MGLADKSRFFKQSPGAIVSRIAFRVYPVNAGCKKVFCDGFQSFARIAFTAIVFIDYVSDLNGIEIPFAAVHVAYHLAAVF